MSELAELLTDTVDAIVFLRAQMFAGAKPQDGYNQTDTERQEFAREVSTGSKPGSRPPCNLDAMVASDAEMSLLVKWADEMGMHVPGPVWRNRETGKPLGILYGDVRPARYLVYEFLCLLDDGWLPPSDMVEAMRDLRAANRKAWPELSVFLYMDRPKPDPQAALF